MAKNKTVSKAKQTNLKIPSTFDDVKTAVLLVSLLINLFIFITWIVLRVTTKYDEQVFNFLFTR